MALITEAEVRTAARTVTRNKTARVILQESRATSRTSFDIFLSHSRLDEEIVLGVKTILEAAGKSVYVDWVDDPQLNRSAVTPATANTLRQRMQQSNTLFYVHSGQASTSRWMPWELGYFDGLKGNVAILPVVQTSSEATFKGQEYLGLYPYVDMTNPMGASKNIYIHRSLSEFAGFDRWKTMTDKLRPNI